MVKSLVLNVRDEVGRMNVIMLLLSRGGGRGERRVNLMMRMKRGVWVVKKERKFRGRRIGGKRERVFHKDNCFNA